MVHTDLLVELLLPRRVACSYFCCSEGNSKRQNVWVEGWRRLHRWYELKPEPHPVATIVLAILWPSEALTGFWSSPVPGCRWDQKAHARPNKAFQYTIQNSCKTSWGKQRIWNNTSTNMNQGSNTVATTANPKDHALLIWCVSLNPHKHRSLVLQNLALNH